MRVRRRNDGWLAGLERRAITFLLPRLPESVHSDHLTGVALFGAIMASFALVEVRASLLFFAVFAFGMFLNCFTGHAYLTIFILRLSTFGVVTTRAHSPIFSRF